MKTTVKTIAAAALIIISGFTANAQSWDRKSWLSAIPDSAYVCSLSLPGTHDSCTSGAGFQPWAKTQCLTLSEQFEVGIRVFDIRPASTFSHKNVEIYHGGIACDKTWYSVINDFKTELKAHPTEFIIMIVNIESNGVDTDISRKMVKERELSYVGDPYFVQEFRDDLTVGEMRGKILMINRDGMGQIEDPAIPAGFFNGWHSDPSKGTITSGARAGDGGYNETKFYDQDVDHYSDDDDWEEDKFKYFKQTAEEYFADKDYFVWCFNCASAWCGWWALSMDYNENADRMNGHLSKEYFPKEAKFHKRGAWRGVGIVLMDFGGVAKYNYHDTYGGDMIREMIRINYDQWGLSY